MSSNTDSSIAFISEIAGRLKYSGVLGSAVVAYAHTKDIVRVAFGNGNLAEFDAGIFDRHSLESCEIVVCGSFDELVRARKPKVQASSLSPSIFDDIIKRETDALRNKYVAEYPAYPKWIVAKTRAPIDPLDAKHDGCELRDLLQYDERNRRETGSNLHYMLTPSQRAAVSAYWSAQLRAKVDATKQSERTQVVCDWQDEP